MHGGALLMTTLVSLALRSNDSCKIAAAFDTSHHSSESSKHAVAVSTLHQWHHLLLSQYWHWHGREITSSSSIRLKQSRPSLFSSFSIPICQQTDGMQWRTIYCFFHLAWLCKCVTLCRTLLMWLISLHYPTPQHPPPPHTQWHRHWLQCWHLTYSNVPVYLLAPTPNDTVDLVI